MSYHLDRITDTAYGNGNAPKYVSTLSTQPSLDFPCCWFDVHSRLIGQEKAKIGLNVVLF